MERAPTFQYLLLERRFKMALPASDFVLDEGLDDDEDVLAFHDTPQELYSSPPETDSESIKNEEKQSLPPVPPSSSPSNADNRTPEHPPCPVVIIDGLPLNASRADLDSMFDFAPITSVQLRRLERDHLLRMRVEFSSIDSAAAALAKDGTEFLGSVVSIKTASDERWEASSVQSKPMRKQAVMQPKQPDVAQAQSRFWGAFATAKNVAQQFEKRAKELGEDLERRLQINEKVEDTKRAIEQLDDQFAVSKTVSEVTKNSKQMAEQVDRNLGISKGVSKVASDMSGAARIVAREVDENFRVGDRARTAANKAIKSETFGNVAKTVVGTLDGDPPSGKKKRMQPSVVDTAEESVEIPEAKSSQSDQFEVGG